MPIEPNANRGSAARPRVVISSAVRARGSPRTLPRAIADAASWAPRLIELEANGSKSSAAIGSAAIGSAAIGFASADFPTLALPLAGRSLGDVLGAVALAVLL